MQHSSHKIDSKNAANTDLNVNNIRKRRHGNIVNPENLTKHYGKIRSWLHRVPRKSLLNVVFSRFFVAAVMIVFQVLFIMLLATRLDNQYEKIATTIVIPVISAIISIIIINKEGSPAYKISWIVPIAAFPLFGSLLYIIFHFNLGSIRATRAVRHSIDITKGYTDTEPIVKDCISIDARLSGLSHYIENTGGYPSYSGTSAKYYSMGDYAYDDIIASLKKAEDFIFMEFFIITPGIFWNSILDILIDKALAGVEVRLIYDDIGCMNTLPMGYASRLRSFGIKVRTFARVTPFFSTSYNNRDHRKIIVIDGKYAFSGGLNLADEYINRKARFGVWKDNCFMLEGDAVRSYTLMFLQMWNAIHENKHEDYGYYLHKSRFAVGGSDGSNLRKDACRFDASNVASAAGSDALPDAGSDALPDADSDALTDAGSDALTDADGADSSVSLKDSINLVSRDKNGFSETSSIKDFSGIFIPYGDGPQSKISVAQSVYLHLINTAVNTLYIMTPYLVLDDEMLMALMRAAKRGTDVRIILPRIPDKRLVNTISKSYYPNLIESGVRIYEYLPGFVHTKMICADKKEAVTGTINMDFRSLYLHYECACVMYNNPVVGDISADFEKTFAESAEISMRDYKKINIIKRFIGKALRIIAPLV